MCYHFCKLNINSKNALLFGFIQKDQESKTKNISLLYLNVLLLMMENILLCAEEDRRSISVNEVWHRKIRKSEDFIDGNPSW